MENVCDEASSCLSIDFNNTHLDKSNFFFLITSIGYHHNDAYPNIYHLMIKLSYLKKKKYLSTKKFLLKIKLFIIYLN